MLYEFECQCGAQFEARRSLDERNHAECPKCGKQANKRISLVHNTFGWTRTLCEAGWKPGMPDELVRDI